MNVKELLKLLRLRKAVESNKLPRLTKLLLLTIREIWNHVFQHGTEEDVELVEQLIAGVELYQPARFLKQCEVEDLMRCKKDKLDELVVRGLFPEPIHQFEGEKHKLWDSRKVDECIRLRASGALTEGYYHD